MKLPAILVFVSAVVAVAGWTLDARTTLEIGSLMILAALILCGIGFWRGTGLPRRQAWAVIDGSNVMFWGGQEANLRHVAAVVRAARAEGHEPIVWFDANAGYRVSGRYLNACELAKYLRLPVRQVMIAPKGTPADPLILDSATRLAAPVITNDRYRDWFDQYPLAADPTRMIRGRIANGAARLDRVSPRAAA